VENYYQCVREEEERVRGRFAAIRIQAFLRGAAARGGVTKLRLRYLSLRAARKLQAVFRGMRGRRRAAELARKQRRARLSVNITRVWRGAVVRREVARQTRARDILRNRHVAATMIEALVRGHLGRVAREELVRQRAQEALQASMLRSQQERAAMLVQCMFRSYRSRGVYWAAVTSRKQAQLLNKLRVTNATRIQNIVRRRIARGVLRVLREREANRRFVLAVTKLQARVQAWKARALAKILREQRQWFVVRRGAERGRETERETDRDKARPRARESVREREMETQGHRETESEEQRAHTSLHHGGCWWRCFERLVAGWLGVQWSGVGGVCSCRCDCEFVLRASGRG
jgi:hypothetical protein